MKPIVIAARDSRLSKAQVYEVYRELSDHHEKIVMQMIWMSTQGDRELSVSLRHMEKTDFFTHEIDQFLLQGRCRVAIHSAKDLPDPLPHGLKLIACTKGVDPSDSLVLHPTGSLHACPRVGVSCERRENMVRKIFPHAQILDLRGTIDSRLQQLARGDFDAIVVAEAALIRLQLTHLKRIPLFGEPAPYQGRLAIVSREDDDEMATLFAPLHV